MRAELLTLVLLAGVGLPVAAAGQDAAGAAPAASPFRLDGSFDVGYRWTDPSGNRDKYREDLNLESGPRLFNLNLNLTPSAPGGAFDLLNVTADHLGGDPFESFGVTLRRYGSFDLRYRRTKAAYFYHDILLPPDRASFRLSNGGDFHTFDLDRTTDRLDFNFDIGRRADVFLKFNHQARTGESTTTRDFSRDEFELDAPLDQTKDDLSVGFTADLGAVSVYFDETFRDYESDGRIFLPGASPGENLADQTQLFAYERLLPFDFRMPQSTVRVHVKPNRRFDLTGSVIYNTLDGEFEFVEAGTGIQFTGAPLGIQSAGRGDLDRTTKIVDVDAQYELGPRVALVGSARFGRFDQQAVQQQGAAEIRTGAEISTDIGELGVRVHPYRNGRLALAGGVRFESRDTILEHEDGLEVFPATERATFFVSGSVRPGDLWDLTAEYERGDYDNPFTLIAPTALDRAKVRARYDPEGPIRLVGTLQTQRIDNDLSGAKIDSLNFTGYAEYERDDLRIYGSYSRQELTNDVVNLLSFGTLFSAFYESSVDMGLAGARLPIGETTAVGGEVRAYRNRGSFGIDWREYRLFGELRSPAGYTLRLAYQRNGYEELQFEFDDYRANLVTLTIGYEFR